MKDNVWEKNNSFPKTIFVGLGLVGEGGEVEGWWRFFWVGREFENGSGFRGLGTGGSGGRGV